MGKVVSVPWLLTAEMRQGKVLAVVCHQITALLVEKEACKFSIYKKLHKTYILVQTFIVHEGKKMVL